MTEVNFEEDILSLRTKLLDDIYARKMYRALCNVNWKHYSGKVYSCSWRYAGGLVALFRCMGEDYMDFYLSGNESSIDSDILIDLGLLGWEPIIGEKE